MAVVGVREVRMRMGHGFMAMPVCMRASRRKLVMLMVLMMRVVRMRVGMFKHLMVVGVGVMLCQVKPDAQRHQACRCQQLPGHRFCQKKNGKQRPDEWRY